MFNIKKLAGKRFTNIFSSVLSPQFHTRSLHNHNNNNNTLPHVRNLSLTLSFKSILHNHKAKDIKHWMNSIISETQSAPLNLHNLDINHPLSPYLISLLSLFVSVSTLILFGLVTFGRKLNLIFSLCLSPSPSPFPPSCWYQNAHSVKLKPMHFWLWNKFAPLMRLELVQGSAMKTLLHLFPFMLELSTA